MADQLTDRLLAITRAAAQQAAEPEARSALEEVAARLEGPVRLAIAGRVKAGKSTLLNALIGEELAPTDAGECTRVLTWYRHSDRPYALLHLRDGRTAERPYSRRSGALKVDLGEWETNQAHHLEVGWPTSRLTDLVLIDTPGLASLSTDVSARTHEFMSAESGTPPVADAVLYLLRHTHVSDMQFLEAFHDDDVAQGTPVNTVGVLSRADEIGASRLDAMDDAARVARRYEHEPRLHRLCPVVVPVNGLLGHAASTLRESDYSAFRAVAQAPVNDVEELLLTADRFATRSVPARPTPEERSALLSRFGLFGVRLAVELVRSGQVRTSTELADRLTSVSGIDRLREVVTIQFRTRSRILKARSAVAALEAILRRGACHGSEELLGRLERVRSSAHELEEMRVLLELRSGALNLPASRAEVLDRLMGGSGHDPASRLGLPTAATHEQVRASAFDALRDWQTVARHPLSERPVQIAAQAATRTLEGLLATGP